MSDFLPNFVKLICLLILIASIYYVIVNSFKNKIYKVTLINGVQYELKRKELIKQFKNYIKK